MLSDRDAIQKMHQDWCIAVRNADIDILRDLLTADYEAWPAGTAALSGREEAIKALQMALDATNVEQSYESTELLIDGDLAVDRGVESFVLTPRSRGPARKHRQRAILIMRKSDGKWRYSRSITSPIPFDAGISKTA